MYFFVLVVVLGCKALTRWILRSSGGGRGGGGGGRSKTHKREISTLCRERERGPPSLTADETDN